MKRSDTIHVSDELGFTYEVNVKHQPNLGFSTAYHKGSVVEQVDTFRLPEPFTGDDLEWEKYEERYSEWRDDVIYLVRLRCHEHFKKRDK